MPNYSSIKNWLLGFLFLMITLFITNAIINHEVDQLLKTNGYAAEAISANILTGNLCLKDIQSISDNSAADALFIQGKVNSLKLNGFSIWDFYYNDKVSIEGISIENGLINIDPTLDTESDTTTSSKLDFKVKNIIVDSIYINVKGKKGSKKWNRVSGMLSTAELHQLSNNDTTTFNLEVNHIKGDSIIYRHSLDLHEIKIPQLVGDKEALHLHNLNIEPSLSESAFAKNPYGRKEMFNLDIETIDFKQIDWIPLLTKGHIIADSLAISNSDFRIYVNENIESLNPKQYKALPTERTLKSSIKYNIPIIDINRASITFEQKAKGKDQIGSLNWTNVEAEITNVTNLPSRIEQHPLTKFDITTKFMDEADLQVYATFDLTDPQSTYEVKFELAPMSMKPLNKILRDVARINVKQGQIEYAEATFKANDIQAKGTLNFRYKDLKIRMLDDDLKETNNPFKWIGTRVLIKENNVGKDAEVGEIDSKRDQTSSIWEQLWTSVFDGFKDIVFPGFMDGA